MAPATPTASPDRIQAVPQHLHRGAAVGARRLDGMNRGYGLDSVGAKRPEGPLAEQSAGGLHLLRHLLPHLHQRKSTNSHSLRGLYESLRGYPSQAFFMYDRRNYA